MSGRAAMLRRQVSRLVVAVFVASYPMVFAWATDSCPSGLVGVVGQITRMEPVGTKASKLTAQGAEASVGVGELLCAGETLLLKAGGSARRAEIYTGGTRRTLEVGERFTASANPTIVDKRALELLAEVAGADDGLRPPPDIPLPSVPRSSGDGDKAPPVQISAMRSLRGLPRQSIAWDVSPVLAWREGVGPYECAAVSEFGDAVWKLDIPAHGSWCAIGSGQKVATQLVVLESRGPTVIWNVRWINPAVVPRPSWLASSPRADSDLDRAAWAAWLWSHGDGQWRLHALGVLNELAGRAWLAGYVRDRLLAEVVLPVDR